MGELQSIVQAEHAPATRSYLFYGAPGTGKTWLAAMHPGKRKLWIDMDQKLNELAELPNRSAIQLWQPHETIGNPDKIDIPYSPDPKNVHTGSIPSKKPLGYEKAVTVTNELLNLRKGEFPYDCIVLDTLTRLGDHWTRLLMYTHRVSFMTERLWGIYLAGMTEFLNGFLQLPCDRIVLVHEKRNTDEDTKQESIRPSVAGQLGNNLGQYFTEAYYLLGRERSGAYKLQTVSDSRISARTSKKMDPQVIAGPDVYK